MSDVIIFKEIFEALLPIVQTFAAAAVPGLVGLGLAWLKKKWNIQIDSDMRDSLNASIMNVAGSLIAKGAVKLEGTQVTIHNDHVAWAVNEVLSRATDAAKHFNLTKDDADRIVDRLKSAITQMPGTPSVQVAQTSGYS